MGIAALPALRRAQADEDPEVLVRAVKGNCRIEGEIIVRGTLNVEGDLSGTGWQKTLKTVRPPVIDK